MPLAEQLLAFVWTVLIGMFSGFCFQVYGVIKEKLKLKRVGTFAGDIIFSISITIIAFALLLQANNGQLRLYFFVGLLFGILVYAKYLAGISHILINKFFFLIIRLINLVALLFYYIWKVLSFPFKVILGILQYPVQLAGRLLLPVKTFTGRVTGRHLSMIRSRVHSLAEKIAKRFGPPS